MKIKKILSDIKYKGEFKNFEVENISYDSRKVVDGTLFVAIEGEKFEWERGDTIAAPVWKWIEHCSSEDSVVFRMTAEPIMNFARYYRIEGDWKGPRSLIQNEDV